MKTFSSKSTPKYYKMPIETSSPSSKIPKITSKYGSITKPYGLSMQRRYTKDSETTSTNGKRYSTKSDKTDALSTTVKQKKHSVLSSSIIDSFSIKSIPSTIPGIIKFSDISDRSFPKL